MTNSKEEEADLFVKKFQAGLWIYTNLEWFEKEILGIKPGKKKKKASGIKPYKTKEEGKKGK